MRHVLFLFLAAALLATAACAQPTALRDDKPTRTVKTQAQQNKLPQYRVYKGRDFSFRYPANWTISAKPQLFWARGFGHVSVNNFNREDFWPGAMTASPSGGGAWSTEIAQLQIPENAAYLMIWTFEGPGNPDNLPDKLDKAELKYKSKAKGARQSYSLSFQSGGIPYQLDLFLNGRAARENKKEALAIIDSLKLER